MPNSSEQTRLDSLTIRDFHLRKLVIIGVGLIGGSLALALKRAGVVETVVGVGRSAANLQRAVELGVIDEVADNSPAGLAQALKGADMVVVCTPVAQTFAVLHSIEPYLELNTLVTDAGSTKGDVIMAAKTALGDKVVQFVPAHPIAGREQHGVEAALADLYDGKKTVLCPLQENHPLAVQRVQTLWEVAGSQCHVMAAVQHDAIFAAVSHLPHVLAYALVAQIANAEDAEMKFSFAGGGFRDFTRIAASSPEMWRDICLANRAAIVQELNTYQAILTHLKTSLEKEDGATLEKIFGRASAARVKWGEGKA